MTAGTINNAVQGDIHHTVGPVHHGVDAAQIADLVQALRAELARAPMSERARTETHRRLDEVERTAGRTGERGGVERVRDVVRSVGGVIADAAGAVTAGSTLWGAVSALAAAVGLAL